MTTRIVAISAGLGDPSTTRMLADRIAAASANAIDDNTSIEVVNLREFAHEITDAALAGFAGPGLQHVYDLVGAADALIVVVPTFKASYPGLFKSFIDALDNEALTGKIVLLAATGGTARHSLVIDYALRPLFAYLQAVVIPTGIFASGHDWGSGGETALQSRIGRAAAELASLLGGNGSGRSADDEIDLFSPSMLSISQPQ